MNTDAVVKYYKVIDTGYDANARMTVKLKMNRTLNNQSYFSITATIGEKNGGWSGGCLHEQIAKYFPELEYLIKWHLVGEDAPMYYIENTMYWMGFRGWCDGKVDSPPNLEHAKSTMIYGALESDSDVDPETFTEEELKAWMLERLPKLMDLFWTDMVNIFRKDEKDLRVEKAQLPVLPLEEA